MPNCFMLGLPLCIQQNSYPCDSRRGNIFDNFSFFFYEMYESTKCANITKLLKIYFHNIESIFLPFLFL